MYQNLAIIGVIILLYSLVAGKVEKKPISGSMVFLFAGLCLGPFLFDFLDIKFKIEGYKVLSEFALALVLFTDASKANLQVLRSHVAIPNNLLMIGLPITLVLGVLVGKLVFPQMSWVELGVLSAVLSPTDAALGEPVVNNKNVPVNIREGINVESGLNDGICVPILVLFLAMHSYDVNEHVSFWYAIGLFVKEIGIGVLVGLCVTFVADVLIKHGLANHWIESSWKSSIIIVLSLTCFSLAQALGGSGFIAAFVGGLMYNHIAKTYKPELLIGALGVGKILNASVWVIFGCVITAKILPLLTFPIVIYSLASLTIIRILPVMLCLRRNKISRYGKFFIAWFGPRGLASIVFAAIVFEESLSNGNVIVVTTCFTILLSVFAHGISAVPMTKVFMTKK